MASTYSTSLRLELMATGDQSGTWGTTTNTNLGTLLEQSITGVLSVAQGDVANLTLTTVNGGTDQARNAVVNLTGALTAQRNVVVQTANKLYLIKNSTTGGFSIVAKTAAGTGVTILPGTSQWVYSDGTNVVAGLIGNGVPDGNGNLAANNFLEGYATTATAAGTTTLTVASAHTQYFTGATTQTITLPVVSTLVLGQEYEIVNLSTGALTVNSSGGNLVATIPALSTARVQAILVTGTTAASWEAKGPLLLSGSYLPLAGGVLSTTAAGTLLTLTSTDAGATSGPDFEQYRNSASPAANDVLGVHYWYGQDSAGNKQEYASRSVAIASPTSTTEAAIVTDYVTLGGTRTAILYEGALASGTADANAVGLPKGQLSFPATQNPSSSANTLDDYAEGTWTPTFAASGATFSYASQVGNYTKIGNRVFVTFRIQLNTTGNMLAANALSITGLPFANGNTVADSAQTFWNGATSSYVNMGITLASGATSFAVVGITAAGVNMGVPLNSSTALSATAGSVMSGQINYKV